MTSGWWRLTGEKSITLCYSHAAMSRPAIRHLSTVDPVMRALIRRVRPCGLAMRNHSPFETLVRAIAHQQIHGRAAEAILGRFIALFPGRRFPRPADIATVDARKMRRAGFSRAKTALDQGHRAQDARAGCIPTRRRLSPADRRRADRAAHPGARGRPVDGGDAADVHPRPPGRAAGGRLRGARGLQDRLRPAQAADPEAAPALRRALEPVPLDRGLVPLARGREGAAPQDRARRSRSGGTGRRARRICSGLMP